MQPQVTLYKGMVVWYITLNLMKIQCHNIEHVELFLYLVCLLPLDWSIADSLKLIMLLHSLEK